MRLVGTSFPVDEEGGMNLHVPIWKSSWRRSLSGQIQEINGVSRCVAGGGPITHGARIEMTLRDLLSALELERSLDQCGDKSGAYMPFNVAME